MQYFAANLAPEQSRHSHRQSFLCGLVTGVALRAAEYDCYPSGRSRIEHRLLDHVGKPREMTMQLVEYIVLAVLSGTVSYQRGFRSVRPKFFERSLIVLHRFRQPYNMKDRIAKRPTTTSASEQAASR